MILPNRQSPRRQEYDYSSSWWYFVTICTADREPYFGQILGDNMIYTDIWQYCHDQIINLPNHRPNIEIHEFVVMSDHVHILLLINDKITTNPEHKSPTLWSLINMRKWSITRYAKENNIPFWRQSRYNDRIIRNDDEYQNIKYYIQKNISKESMEI